MKIVIGSDHAGYALKQAVAEHLRNRGMDFTDFGTYGETAADYPDIAAKVAAAVADGRFDRGILVCGTGVGMSMAANKIKGIRAAAVTEHFGARYTRAHNDANILCLGERVTGPGTACDLTDIFLSVEFEGGRHAARVDKIMNLEKPL